MRKARWQVRALVGICAAACAFIATDSFAACTPEIEPNNEPAQIAVGNEAPSCVTGTAGSGDQDFVALSIPPDAASGRWRVRLDLLPGQSARVVLARPEPPPADAPPDALARTLGFDGTQAPTVLWQGASAAGEAQIVSDELLLDSGPYLIGLTTAEERIVWRLRLDRVGDLPAPLDVTASLSGSFEGKITGTGQTIDLPWRLTEADATQRWKLGLQLAPRGYGSITLIDAAGQSLASNSTADPDGGIRLRDLGLTPGDYRVQLSNLAEGVVALASASPEGPRLADLAEEPDDLEPRPHPIALGQRWTGRLVARGGFDDIDQYIFTVDESTAQRLLDVNLRAEGPARLTLALSEAGGGLLIERSREREVRLRGLNLKPGSYRLSVRGMVDERQTYALAIDDRGPLDGGAEREPNDVVTRAMPIAADGPITGSFEGEDRDYLKLRIEGGLQLWSFTAIGEGLSSVSLFDSTGAVVASERISGSSLQLSRLLLAPGEHLLLLEGEGGSWLARATPLGPPAPNEEVEPNDTLEAAMPLGFDGPQRLWLDRGGDVDRYAFYLAAPHRLTLALDAPAEFAANMVLEWPRSSVRLASVDTTPDESGKVHARYDAVLPAGDYLLLVRSNGARSREPLTLEAALSPPFDPPVPDAAVDASITLDSAEIAAFHPEGQRIGATLSLRNSGERAIAVVPRPWFGDERWRAEGLPDRIDLAPGAAQALPFTIVVAPDARDERPIQLAIGLLENDRASAIALASLSPEIGIDPVSPFPADELPRELEGGINVAWSALGASSNAPAATDGLIDGRPSAISREEGLLVDLAGAEPIAVLGFVIVPPSGDAPEEIIKRFAIEVLGADGRFERVLEGDVSPLARPQAFVLPTPIGARSVRLVALERQWPQDGGRITLGEFKVIAERGAFAPAFDVARRELGGHIVWTEPQTEAPVTGESASWPSTGQVGWDEDRTATPNFVLAFLSSRAALIDSVALTVDTGGPPAQSIQRVRVQGSTTGPFGPWQELGAIMPDAASGRGVLALEKPGFVRHLKFTIEQPASGDIALPKAIEVIEHATDSGYRSILGEWGGSSQASEYERSLATDATAPATAGAGRDRASAVALPAGTVATGRIRFGEGDHWYRLELAADAQSVRLTLGGKPTVDSAVALTDADGREISLVPDVARHGSYVARVAGGTHFVRVWQPSRSVVVAWDTSMSVGNFVSTIIRAVRRLSTDLDVGREAVNLVPFRGEATDPLLDEFTGTREGVWSALHGYGWGDSDSDAERALIVSSAALSARQGPRAIVLITDASSNGATRNSELWRRLDAVRPRIFSLHIPTGEGADRGLAQVHLMQDWAYSSGGFYSVMGSTGEADVAFRRLAARLRTPADYTLSYDVSTAPPTPGRLAVSAPEPGGAAASRLGVGSALAIILDASGSMLQRLEGRRKIEIAKATLTNIVTKSLPAGSPVALRVFGQGGKGSCRSDLVLPLGPLDPAAASQAIARLRSTNGAKTAIAASLRLAAADLASVAGRRRMILITDGEETCGGDPASEIVALRSEGIDVEMSVVGFDVADAKVRASFEEWARLGGGDYFDASDSAALDNAMQAALQPPFAVLDNAGAPVASGIMGGPPLELAPGRYRVRIDAEPPIELEATILSDETTTLAVPPTP